MSLLTLFYLSDLLNESFMLPCKSKDEMKYFAKIYFSFFFNPFTPPKVVFGLGVSLSGGVSGVVISFAGDGSGSGVGSTTGSGVMTVNGFSKLGLT